MRYTTNFKSNRLIIFFIQILFGFQLQAQTEIPAVYTNLIYDSNGKLYFADKNGERVYAEKFDSYQKLSNMLGSPSGYENGIAFDFSDERLNGKLYFGLINYKDSKHPMPVWFKRTAKIIKGKTKVDLNKLSGIYDMTGWEKSGHGTLGYRVVNAQGEIIYDGLVNFKKTANAFVSAPTIVEGPFISKLTDSSVSVWFRTDKPLTSELIIGAKSYKKSASGHFYEYQITNLSPNTTYKYTVKHDVFEQTYSFRTAFKDGAQDKFTFAYASDSRAGNGGGERNVYGANYYVARQIAALGMHENIAFMQFTGDMIDGYSSDKDELNLQYANWKRAVEPFAHYYPIITAIGNHEFLGYSFPRKNGRWAASVCKFPFETESSSAVYAQNFVNPENGPASEDGASYDPNPDKIDFPPYNETVFYYTYGNVAVIVLNSDYLYAPLLKKDTQTGGNLHAYIMDKQLEWLEEILLMFEIDPSIDHVFISQHTPAFPNGGHVKDDMWYNGDNSKRPVIAGKPVNKGIIERRDEYLDILLNKSTKVVAILTGDEHNYNKVKVTPNTNIYPENYPKSMILERKRTLWQINNGSAGAPYYAQDPNTPWNDAVSGFSTQYALVLIDVEGTSVNVRVLNPVTLELIESYNLRH